MNEPGVCCLAITDDASRVAFGVTQDYLWLQEPEASLRLGVSNQIYIPERSNIHSTSR